MLCLNLEYKSTSTLIVIIVDRIIFIMDELYVKKKKGLQYFFLCSILN